MFAADRGSACRRTVAMWLVLTVAMCGCSLGSGVAPAENLEPGPQAVLPVPAASGEPDGEPVLGPAVAAPSQTTTTTTSEPEAPAVVDFAVIGDFGDGGPLAGAVASMIGEWDADFIVTTGDDTYGDETRETAIGQFYSDYIGAYVGSYGPGSSINRFFPSLGNHDYADGGGLESYLEYFVLPGAGVETTGTSGNERYYDFVWGPVHFFALNSNPGEPDGVTSTSAQARWLQARLAASTAPWQVVFFHHAPYSSGTEHGSVEDSQWPFAEWGADLVLNGHEHIYERLAVDGITYVISGLGVSHYPIADPPLPESRFSYSDDDAGALLVTACDAAMLLEYRTLERGVIDSHSIGSGHCP